MPLPFATLEPGIAGGAGWDAGLDNAGPVYPPVRARCGAPAVRCDGREHAASSLALRGRLRHLEATTRRGERHECWPVPDPGHADRARASGTRGVLDWRKR